MGFGQAVSKAFTPNIEATLRRFPVPIFCSLTLYVLHVFGMIDDDLKTLLPVSLVAGYFMFGVARVAAEARGWTYVKEGLAGSVLTGCMAILLYNGIHDGTAMIPVLAMLLMVGTVPYLLRTSDNFSFWLYNRQLWQGVGFSILAGLLLVAGVAAAITGIKFLFGLDIDIVEYIVSFGCFVYVPFIALSHVPQKFDVPLEDCPNSAGIAFLLNWVLAPLAAVYFAIFYAYAVKILLIWDMPKGHVSYMVMAFGILGILTYLVGWPLRDSSTKLVRFLYRRFFLLLVLPTLLLMLAVYMRIDQYGLTQDRYYVLLIGLWFLIVAVLFSFRPHAPLKIIPTILLVLFLMASFGPWGAVSLSQSHQVARLKDALERNNMLENGVAVPARSGLKIEDQTTISGIVDYLAEDKTPPKKLVRLVPAFAMDGTARPDVMKIMSTLNVNFIASYERSQHADGKAEGYKRIVLERNKPMREGYPVAGYDLLYTNANFFENKPEITRTFPMQDADSDALILRENRLYFRPEGQAEIEFPIQDIWSETGNDQSNSHDEHMVFDVQWNGGKARYVLTGGSIRLYEDGRRQFESLEGYLLISRN